MGEGVGGYYEPEEEKFYLVDDGGEFGPEDESVFAHEYVHGLQQQHFDLRSTHERLREADNTDRAVAFQALREGDAYLLQTLYEQSIVSPQEAGQASSQPSDALIQAFRSAPHMVQRAYLYPLQEGFFFAATLYRRNGWTAVTEAFGDIPVSTEQVLHPEKYFAQELPVDVQAPELLDLLGEGWSEVMQDTMGEFFLKSYMETGVSFQDAEAAAAGWGGDRFTLMTGPDDEDLLVSYMTWDSEADAKEFFDIFVEFTLRRGEAELEPPGDLPEARMVATQQGLVLVVHLGDVETAIVYAPDRLVLDMVSTALEPAISEGP